jgi:hypothetical protein
MKQAYKLKNYLLSHEDDIATNQEDYGELKETFNLIIGHYPQSYEDKKNVKSS